MILLGLLDPEDEGTTVLQNTGNYTHNDTAPHPKDVKTDTAVMSETWARIYDTRWHHISWSSEPQI
jgi:hypothetical protein